LPSVTAFLDRDGRDDEGGDRVGPRPAERGVQDQADQQDDGQVGAAQGLLGVRRPVVDEARSARVWQRVEALSGAYEMAP
jgi:hypothetical protein